MNAAAVTLQIVDWLRTYADAARARGFAVGVSGGIDSAVTAGLCAATGLEVHLIEMPIHQAPDQVSRAQEWMRLLAQRHTAVSARRVDLTAVFDAHVAALGLPESALQTLALANTRARLRMATLYAVAQNQGLLVVGTGNKVEDFGVGFFTKYGDGGVDLSPIADLYKSQVYAVARHLGVPQAILDAPPTDGLWNDGRTDEDQLGASYAELESAMEFARIHHWSPESTDDDRSWATHAGLSDRPLDAFLIYTRFHRANLHKMRPIPVCKIATGH